MGFGVIFCGASGTGKSTLAEWAAAEFRADFLKSVQSDVYRDRGTTFGDAMVNPPLLRSIQEEIHERTADRLRAACRGRNDFVTDRGPDVLAYSALMCPDIWPTGFPVTIDELIRRERVALFFIRPCEPVLENARAMDAGRRNLFLSDEWVYRVDGAIAYHLAARAVPCVKIGFADLDGRKKLIRETVRTRFGWSG